MTPKQLATSIDKILNEFKAENIVVLDVTKISPITDYMVIGTATSSRHAHALNEHLVELVKARHGVKALSVSGGLDSNWVLVDFGSVIVHILIKEARELYDLEGLWARHQTKTSTKKKTVAKKSAKKPIKKKTATKKLVAKKAAPKKATKKSTRPKAKTPRKTKSHAA